MLHTVQCITRQEDWCLACFIVRGTESWHFKSLNISLVWVQHYSVLFTILFRSCWRFKLVNLKSTVHSTLAILLHYAPQTTLGTFWTNFRTMDLCLCLRGGCSVLFQVYKLWSQWFSNSNFHMDFTELTVRGTARVLVLTLLEAVWTQCQHPLLVERKWFRCKGLMRNWISDSSLLWRPPLQWPLFNKHLPLLMQSSNLSSPVRKGVTILKRGRSLFAERCYRLCKQTFPTAAASSAFKWLNTNVLLFWSMLVTGNAMCFVTLLSGSTFVIVSGSNEG